MNSRRLSLLFTVFIILLTILPYLNITTQDKYFPYWDTYEIKILSETVGTPNFTSATADHLTYFNFKVFHDVTSINYYYILKYGTFLFISLITLSIYLLLREFTKNKQLEKPIILITIFYFFLSKESYLRFSMTLRENLVIGIGLLFLFILTRSINKKQIPDYRLIFILSILLTYVIGGHTLVALVAGGTFAILFLFLVYARNHQYKAVLISTLTTIVLSIPFFLLQYPGVNYQLLHGFDITQRRYLPFNYFLINSTNFYIPLDLIIIAVSLLLIFFQWRTIVAKIKILFCFSITISLGFILAYFPRFGMPQDRFVIYIYLILSFFLFLLLLLSNSLFKNRRIQITLYSLIILTLIITTIPSAMKFNIYRPIRETQINFIQQLVSTNQINLNQTIYCGDSSCQAIIYLFPYARPSTHLITIKNLPLINFESDQIILFNADFFSYQQQNQPLAEHLTKNKEHIHIS